MLVCFVISRFSEKANTDHITRSSKDTNIQKIKVNLIASLREFIHLINSSTAREDHNTTKLSSINLLKRTTSSKKEDWKWMHFQSLGTIVLPIDTPCFCLYVSSNLKELFSKTKSMQSNKNKLEGKNPFFYLKHSQDTVIELKVYWYIMTQCPIS